MSQPYGGKARESRKIHSDPVNTIVHLVERTAFNQNKHFRNIIYIIRKMHLSQK